MPLSHELRWHASRALCGASRPSPLNQNRITLLTNWQINFLSESDPEPLGGHALPVGLLLPRWLILLIFGIAAAMLVAGASLVLWLR